MLWNSLKYHYTIADNIKLYLMFINGISNKKQCIQHFKKNNLLHYIMHIIC